MQVYNDEIQRTKAVERMKEEFLSLTAVKTETMGHLIHIQNSIENSIVKAKKTYDAYETSVKHGYHDHETD